MHRERVDARPRSPWMLWSALASVVAGGAILRLHGLSARSFSIDESLIYLYASRANWWSALLDPDYTSDPPLFVFLMHFWSSWVRCIPEALRADETRDFMLRLFPCLIGVVTIPLVFLTGRTVAKDDRVGMLGALFFALSPLQVYYAHECRNYTLHTALAVGAFLFMVRALERNRPLDWMGWVLCATAALYNNFTIVWIIAAFNVFFVLSAPWYANRLKPWILCNLLVIFLSIPSLRLMFIVNSTFERAQEHWYPYPTLRLLVLTFKAFFMGYSPNRAAYVSMSAVAGALTLAGMFYLRRKPKALLVLSVTALVPITMSALHFRTANFPYYTHRLMIFSAVPWYLLVAAGCLALRRRGTTALAVSVIAALMIPGLGDLYLNRLHPSWEHRIGVLQKIDHRRAAKFVEARLESGDIVAHRIRYSACPFRYYVGEDALVQRCVCFTEEGSRSASLGYPRLAFHRNMNVVPERINTFIDGAPRAWYVKSFWEPNAYDVEGELLGRWLDHHAFRMLRQPFDGLTVSLYQNRPSLRDAATEITLADLGDGGLSYYFFPATDDAKAFAAVWDGNFTCLRPDLARLAPSGFALRFDVRPLAACAGDTNVTHLGDGPLAASFPSEADDAFSYAFTVANGTAAPRRLDGNLYASSGVIEPLSFARNDPLNDTWQPYFAFDPGPPTGLFNVPIMQARPGQGDREDNGLYRDIVLEAGAYGVWAWIIRLRDPVPAQRAEVRFAVAGFNAPGAPGVFQEIGRTDGACPEGAGWGWHRIGTLAWPGGRLRFRVSAHNPHDYPAPYFDLGRILFMDAGMTSFALERFSISLAPGEERSFHRNASMDGHPLKRVDIEVFDEAARAFRNIDFTVRHKGPSTPEGVQ